MPPALRVLSSYQMPRVGQVGSLSGNTRFFRRVCRGIWAQRHGVDQLAPQVSLLVQNDLGTLKAVQSVNTNQAAPPSLTIASGSLVAHSHVMLLSAVRSAAVTRWFT